MNKTIIAVAALAGFAAAPASALNVSVVDGNADNGASLAAALLGAGSGINILSTSFIGASNQSATYTDFNLTSSDPGEPNLSLPNGILLTSGNANIDTTTNTSTGFGQDQGNPGDADLNNDLAGTPGFDGSNDANVLSIEFTVDPGVTSIDADFVFTSEEFSEYPGFVDAFGFFVDGVNFARFLTATP